MFLGIHPSSILFFLKSLSFWHDGARDCSDMSRNLPRPAKQTCHRKHNFTFVASLPMATGACGQHPMFGDLSNRQDDMVVIS